MDNEAPVCHFGEHPASAFSAVLGLLEYRAPGPTVTVPGQTVLGNVTRSQVLAGITHRDGFMSSLVKCMSLSMYICLEYKRLKCLQSN